MLLILGVVLIGTAAGLAIHAVALPRLRAAQRLSHIDSYGYPTVAAEPEAPRGPLALAIDRLAERLGGAAMPSFGESAGDVRTLLMSAGMYGVAPNVFLGYRLLGAVVLPVAWIWFSTTVSLSAPFVIVGVPLVAFAGWILPLAAVRDRAERRLGEIDYELPELIDSLVVTVEAGSGFNSALQMAAQELGGPLGDEITLALREQSMGLSSDAALENFLRRVETPSTRAFVRAVVQGESLGVSIGEIMRSLGVEMRARRRSAAEARAQKAPVRVLFPLVLLIFPAMLIVLLYPAVRNISQTLGGG